MPGWTATMPAEQTRLEREIQLAAFESVPFVPLGRYMPRVAWSKAVSATR